MKLQESVKMFCLGLLVLTSFIAVFVWTDFNPDALSKQLRVFTVVSLIFSISGIVWSFVRIDKVPDYLAKIGTPYFDCSGFCFLIDIVSIDDKPKLIVIFQNRHDTECHTQVAIRSKHSLISPPASIRSTKIKVYCPPAGFGIEVFPITIQEFPKIQYLDIEVGASVEYPNGAGRTLRFREGVAIRFDSDFRNGLAVGATVVGAIGGKYLKLCPPSIKIEIQREQTKEASLSLLNERGILWQLGDAPLKFF